MRNLYLGYLLLAFIVFGTRPTASDEAGMDRFEGEYQYTFRNGLMNGQKYESENTLVVLKLTAKSAYFKTHLEWANGHTCNLSGVVDLDPDGTLTYRKPSIEGRTCVFSIKMTNDKLVLGDEGGACRLIACGARGRISGVEFTLKERTRLPRDQIKRSGDFKRAIEEHDHQPGSPSKQE